jgi:hypothetical protein
MQVSVRTALAAGVAIFVMASTPAFAAIMNFKADLKAASEVPATKSTGTGTVDANLDTTTMKLTWTVTYSGLTGKAVAAHFHGPAKVGKNAPPAVPIKGSLTSPIRGSAKLTAKQMKDLEGGLWYFNIHTAKYPNGEVRGQMTKQ